MKKMRGNQKGTATARQQPAAPATAERSEHYIDLRGKSQAEIVAINLSIGDARAIPDLLMLCTPRAASQSTTDSTATPIAKLPIPETA